MRIIDADKLYPDCLTKEGTLAISQSQIANAPTIEPDIERINKLLKTCTRTCTLSDYLKEELAKVLSAQPEIKPIEYRDCANAMMKMWIDNVLTDGEYNRIMDKLNAHWAEMREE